MHAFDYPTLKPRRPKTNPPAREDRRGVSGERQGITVPSGALPDPACADGVAVVFTDVSARDLFKVSPDEGVGCELEVRADGVLAPTAVKFGAEGLDPARVGDGMVFVLAHHLPGARNTGVEGALLVRLLVATDLINRFDRLQTPEQTEGKEGYWWFTDCEANAAECRLTMNIRDFDRSRYDSRKAFVLEAVEAVRAQHPRAVIETELVDVYSNIADSLGDDRSPVELLYKAADNLGITTNTIAMRGGTDGSALSAKGLVTPNYFTGACNFHSYAEFLPLPSLHKSLEMTLELVRLTAGK